MKTSLIHIITGLSGSGKSTAIAAFEDAGFYCVDNMPVALLPKFLELPVENDSNIKGLAFVMDLRESDFVRKYPSVFDDLARKGRRLNVLFLEADEEVLIRRYSETRRHHPASDKHRGLLDSIRHEADQLRDLRNNADCIIDTSRLNPHELKAKIQKIAQEYTKTAPMRIHVMSFGFKHGIPRDADLICDVRFLRNPYYLPDLKPLDGENQNVRDFVLQDPDAELFLKKYLDLLDYLIPLYEKEGKAYVTIAFGCTGGIHRSVAIARAVYEHLFKPDKPLEITHRDLGYSLQPFD
jgi:RNase adapter protein RapZ